jgi:hypothetical protein
MGWNALFLLKGRTYVSVFENKVMRSVFGPKRHKVIGEWRKQRNEKFHNFYSAPYIIRVIESGGRDGRGM